MPLPTGNTEGTRAQPSFKGAVEINIPRDAEFLAVIRCDNIRRIALEKKSKQFADYCVLRETGKGYYNLCIKDRTVSANHCVIFKKGKEYYIHDGSFVRNGERIQYMRSKNGTFIDSKDDGPKRITPDEDIKLNNGSTVTVGSVILNIELP